MDSGKLVRQFEEILMFKDYVNLVSRHYRTKHQVADYAELLHKSPKTLVNTFAKYDLPKPIEILHGQLTIASADLITSSEMPIKQLAWDLGYYDLDVFSRCFKKKTGFSPTTFRNHFGNEPNRAKRLVSSEIHALFNELVPQIYQHDIEFHE